MTAGPAAALGALLAAPRAAWAADPGSQPIGCDQTDTRLTISTSSHLDPSCTWTRGIDVVVSDVVLDCQGAHIVAPDRRYGVLVTAPTDVALANVVVRNCHVEGFSNNSTSSATASATSRPAPSTTATAGSRTRRPGARRSPPARCPGSGGTGRSS